MKEKKYKLKDYNSILDLINNIEDFNNLLIKHRSIYIECTKEFYENLNNEIIEKYNEVILKGDIPIKKEFNYESENKIIKSYYIPSIGVIILHYEKFYKEVKLLTMNTEKEEIINEYKIH